MRNSLKPIAQSPSKRVIQLVLYGSLGLGFVLVALLLVYDATINGSLRIRTYVAIGCIAYILCLFWLYKLCMYRVVSWGLLALYTAVAFTTLLQWGLNAAMGVFAASFVIVVAGALLGSRAVVPVAVAIGILILIVQILHSTGIVTPDISTLSNNSSYLDVISYATVIGIFALVIWISDRVAEKALARARQAEKEVRSQKDMLGIELEKQSRQLRDAQLKEIQELYKFATLGQSTAATLHELSNHLSILNLDIDDLKQQTKNSQAIANAQEGIEQINIMVRKTRRLLDTYSSPRKFSIHQLLKQTQKDLLENFERKQVAFTYTNKLREKALILGDPLAISQSVTILLTNALEACENLPNARVCMQLSRQRSSYVITVKDNGIGVPPSIEKQLFKPKASAKPSGLGVGLYIARHLIETHLHGTLTYERPSRQKQSGASFVITIPTSEQLHA